MSVEKIKVQVHITNYGGGKISPNLSALLKFVACIVIALHHYAQNILLQGETDNIIWHIFSAQGGYSAVALFFFLSGYGLAESEQKNHLSFTQFVKKRFWKIYEPVLIVNFLHFVCLQCIAFCKTRQWFELSFSSIFLIDELDYYLWFVSVLFICYFVFAIHSQIRERGGYDLFLLAGTTFIILVFFLRQESINHWISIPFFSLGVIFSEHTTWFKNLQSKKVYWIIIFMALLMCFYVAKTAHAPILIHVLINIIQTVILLFVVGKWNVTVPAWNYYGLSYPIYLVHHKLIDFSLSFGHLLPYWMFIILTLYIGWLLHKTCIMINEVYSWFRNTICRV